MYTNVEFKLIEMNVIETRINTLPELETLVYGTGIQYSEQLDIPYPSEGPITNEYVNRLVNGLMEQGGTMIPSILPNRVYIKLDGFIYTISNQMKLGFSGFETVVVCQCDPSVLINYLTSWGFDIDDTKPNIHITF